MSDHATFLRMLAAEPGDLATLLVYADWLEEQAELDRAAFLRVEHAIRALTHRHRSLAPTAEQLRAIGARLPTEWVTAVSQPGLAGTVWKGKSNKNGFIARLLPDGTLNYTQQSGTFANGTWRQVGSMVLMEMNQRYAEYDGILVGTRIRGRAHNVAGGDWRFHLDLTSDPKLAMIPKNVVTTVFPHAGTPRPKKKRVRKATASKPKAKQAKRKAKVTTAKSTKPPTKTSRAVAKRRR